LLGLVDARGVGPDLARAVGASAARISRPTAATVDTLIGWLGRDALSVHATYGLGSMARSLRATEPDVSDRASRALIERLARERSNVRLIHLLRGIANSAAPAAFETVLPLTAHENDGVRGAAVEALRLMEHPRVDGVLADRLRREQNPNALRSVLNATKTRTPAADLADAVSGVALSSPDSQARYRAVRLLAEWLTHLPSLEPALAEIARNDASEAVRRAAVEALPATRP
jgi:hypothetical protein